MSNDNTGDKKQYSCQFCGKDRKEVEKLIVGVDAAICNECISLCGNILEEENIKTIHTNKKKYDAKKLNPIAIKKHLDSFIVGQDEAKIALSVAVGQHYKKLYNPSKDIKLEKTNVMLMGPTGCGKTLLAQTIADYLGVPFAICDATTLTEAGYVGDDVESIITRLITEADGDVELTQRGIVFVDEIDKITKKSNNVSITRDVSGEGVQQGLLKIIEGTKVRVNASGSKRKHPGQDMVDVDTSNILFIVGGAFIGLDKILNERTNKKGIGFGAELPKDEEPSNLDIVQPEDLIKYGFIPEFIGRFGLITHVNQLTKEQLISILKVPKNALIKQYQYLFGLDKIGLEFTDDALEAIANKATELKTNARGLKNIMEKLLLKYQFEGTELKEKGLETITFTKDTVLNNSDPVLIFNNKNSRENEQKKN